MSMAAGLAGEDLSRQTSSRGSWRSTSVREMWNAPNAFQRSGRQQVTNEEEELKWAAIERLPTYDRMRRGMLRQTMSNGKLVAEEIDMANLGEQEKKRLMDSILRAVEVDNEKFLQKLRARNERVGIDVPKVEVRFEKVSIEGDAYVGSRALPTLLNSSLNMIEGIIGMLKLLPSKKRNVQILQDVSGIILGLDVCADTVVGDDMKRGISGGQRKRVTTGEMLVGPAKAFFMDEISTGLDSSTTFQIVKFMRQMVHILDVTMVISLLQPAPETYDLFDDIILISEGQIVYQGPRENVLEFFQHMGFRCPERKGVADFLQEVTSKKDQEQYWFKKNEPFRYVSVADFAQGFATFHVGQRLVEHLRVPYDKTTAHSAALVKEKYGISSMELFKACFAREWLLMQRNSFVYIFKIVQIGIMATITFTVFFRTEMKPGQLGDSAKYMGALFFSLINVMFNGVAELSMTVFRLPVFFKQRDALFFPGWAFALPIWLTRIPISFMESFIWICLTYYTIGFAPAASRFFKQLMAYFGIHQMALGLFRFIAGLGRSEIRANTIGSFALLIVFVLGGFIVSKNDLEPWMLWSYYISPMMYGQNAIAINEFLDERWSTPVPNAAENTVGKVLLKGRGLFTTETWFWICIGALFGFSILFNLLFVAALTFLDPIVDNKTLIDNDDAENKSKRLSNPEGTDMQVRNQAKKGMVLPFEPLSLAFNHMNYYVDMPPVSNFASIFFDMLTSRNQRRTVVCTIHQPSIDIFEAFDELFLMKRGGRVIYAGPLGDRSHKLVEYFEAIPGVPKIKEGYNPATWMLDVSSAAIEAQNDIDFAEIFANSDLYRRNQELIKELSMPQQGSKDLYFPTQFSQSFLTQCKACFWKQHWSYWRNSQYNAIRFFMTVSVGIIFGIIFWNKGKKMNTQQDIMNLLGAGYGAVLFLGAGNASAVQSVIAVERTVFYRERAAGMYSELPYAFSQVAIETLYVLIQTFAYSLILYGMIGFNWKVDKFLYFYYFIFMCFTYFSMYGMMAVALTPGPQIAAIVMGFFMSFWNLFSGFLVPRTLIPIWWRWYYWGSPIAWTIYGLFASQMGDVKTLVEIPGEKSKPVNQFLKDYLGFEEDFVIPVVFAHVGWVLLFFFLFAYGIKYLNFQRR
ncbi:hypothetical protein DVH24_033428 [Malus domestica]|uniref:ABC transporter domain-containing protein n=1 Tax=Malus domestica TaxID=3750 RepID=A0A498JFM6_MALDO|nr:hypothetical protein DVH24_033428 [Malus domestica]